LLIAPTATELVLLDCLFGECHNLFFGLSLIALSVMAGPYAQLGRQATRIAAKHGRVT
jgi:hypothetical protein